MKNCSEWTTIELFDYAQTRYLISQDDPFEDWLHHRSDLLRFVQDDIDNITLDCYDKESNHLKDIGE